MLQDFNWAAVLQNVSYKMIQSNPPLHTPHYYLQFALSLRKEIPYIFFKFNLLNTDTRLIWTISMALSMFVVMGFDCNINYLLGTRAVL